jgi:uncharacterized protein (DUF1697 family)
MTTYIALLRGINVGGKHLVPMKALKALLENGGFESVKTYIQSGNIVLNSDHQADQVESLLGDMIEGAFGFRPAVLVMTTENFNTAFNNNPFVGQVGNQVHFYFCQVDPLPDEPRIVQLTAPSERHQLIDRVFYLHAPDGIARSKLVANMDRCLGVAVTGRNLNTVNKLMAMT